MNAHDQGRRAGVTGLNIFANPHRLNRGSPECRQWADGWHEGRTLMHLVYRVERAAYAKSQPERFTMLWG